MIIMIVLIMDIHFLILMGMVRMNCYDLIIRVSEI